MCIEVGLVFHALELATLGTETQHLASFDLPVVPMNEVSEGISHLTFDFSTEEGRDENSSKIVDDTAFMVEQNLRKLYQAAHEFGKHQLQVRLDCRPTRSRIENLFVFPFLSRAMLKRTPGLKEQYQQLLDVMAVAPLDAVPIYQELILEMQKHGAAESTVICQVLVECDEVFWVKDLSTGVVLQGHDDDKFRKVFHLVRFEMVVETIPRKNPIIPFRMVPGNWQITDIDDHLDGNLLL